MIKTSIKKNSFSNWYIYLIKKGAININKNIFLSVKYIIFKLSKILFVIVLKNTLNSKLFNSLKFFEYDRCSRGDMFTKNRFKIGPNKIKIIIKVNK